MATNIKKFLENYKLIMDDRSEYVHFGYREIAKTLEICYCIESFTWNDLLIEKGNTYLIRIKPHGYVIYELTGLWVFVGHKAGLLNDRALENGIKGWNIYRKFSDNFKEINLSAIYDFLYKEE